MALVFAGAAALVAPVGAQTPSADRADKRAIVQQAHDAYYSLRREGLQSFLALIRPDWNLVVDGMGTPQESRDIALTILSRLRFAMTLDEKGVATVTHRLSTPTSDESILGGLGQVATGTEQAVQGFLQTWGMFVLTPPFPPVDADYRLVDEDGGYQLTYQEDAETRLTTRLDRELAISEVRIATSDYNAVVRPTFDRTDDGFLLSGYTSEFVPKSAGGRAHLKVSLASRTAEGFRLPSRVTIDATADDAESPPVVITFGPYTVTGQRQP
jgi:hypothetical protein